jgi:long-chain acyl-CoA synthetase
MIGVNTLYNALLNAPGFEKVDTRHVKMANAGGMAVQRAVAERWKAATGTPLIESYGLTETSPAAISNTLDIKEWTGHIGVPVPSTEAAILDDEGREVAIGEVNEICIRGPQVMKEYWNRPDETAKVLTADGWLRTGDMGFMDAKGNFKITDRKKDMIIVSGFKVFPNEIEDVVMMHPGVLEVAAIGAPDAKSGELVKIIVVRKDPALTEQALLEHCRKHLTGYKVPKVIAFREEPLPKSNIGKVLRRELREKVAA